MSSTVLGATGFIGARLVAHLRARGEQVFAPPRGSEEVFERPLGKLYYCIGLTADYARNPAATFEAHSAYLVRLLERARFDSLVYLSSTRLYDGLAEARENAPLNISVTNPRHLYDLTKATGEHFTLLHSQGRGRVARLASVYDAAPDATGFLPDLFRQLARERQFSLDSAPNISRDYVHIDDVIAALTAIIESGQPETIYNVASGENVSNADLVAAINQAGWQVSLARPAVAAGATPVVDIERLKALGVAPRNTLAHVQRYLENLRP